MALERHGRESRWYSTGAQAGRQGNGHAMVLLEEPRLGRNPVSDTIWLFVLQSSMAYMGGLANHVVARQAAIKLHVVSAELGRVWRYNVISCWR